MPNAFSFARFDNAPTAGVPDAVATAGTTQSGAPALTGAINVLTTAASQVAAILPTNFAVGSPLVVRVNTATTATIFPPVGGSINGGSANAAFSVAQNKPTLFFAMPGGIDWVAVLSA